MDSSLVCVCVAAFRIALFALYTIFIFSMTYCIYSNLLDIKDQCAQLDLLFPFDYNVNQHFDIHFLV